MKVDPYSLQMACALIFIAMCIGIGALAHDWYENNNRRKRGPWG